MPRTGIPLVRVSTSSNQPTISSSQHQSHSPGIGGSADDIRGNASPKVKSLAHSIFFHFIDAKGKSFGAEIGRRLKFAEINISGFEDPAVSKWDDASNASANADVGVGVGLSDDAYRRKLQNVGNEVSVETVFEMVVDRDMCNVHGTLHGGCAAYLVDPCSSAPLVTLGLLLGLDGTGVSQSMNLIWHHPVHVGSKVTIKATSMYLTGKIRTARCEIWTGNKLCVSAVHSTINPREKEAPKSKL